jgi:gamma-glutamyl-gamma-aminobutyrate hydrolase PuuD
MSKRPLIGLSADFVDGYARLRRTYLDMVEAAGGIPVILPPRADLRAAMPDRVDGVIEGIIDPKRRFYVGVQWHPERTEAEKTGLGVVRSLVEHAR